LSLLSLVVRAPLISMAGSIGFIGHRRAAHLVRSMQRRIADHRLVHAGGHARSARRLSGCAISIRPARVLAPEEPCARRLSDVRELDRRASFFLWLQVMEKDEESSEIASPYIVVLRCTSRPIVHAQSEPSGAYPSASPYSGPDGDRGYAVGSGEYAWYAIAASYDGVSARWLKGHSHESARCLDPDVEPRLSLRIGRSVGAALTAARSNDLIGAVEERAS
jgi:hypothetical protein